MPMLLDAKTLDVPIDLAAPAVLTTTAVAAIPAPAESAAVNGFAPSMTACMRIGTAR